MQLITLETLNQLDSGRAGAIVNATIRQALADLDDRAADDEKPRKVVITLTLNRLDSGALAAHLESAWKAPAYKTAGTIANLKRDDAGRVTAEFQPMSPDNPNQKVIFDADGEIEE